MYTRITIATMKKKKKPFDRAAWNRAYNKERYKYYKDKGICTQCGAAWARTGRVECEACAAKLKARHDARADERRKQEKALYEGRKAAGLCPVCGKYPPRPNRVTCEKCAQRQRERDINRAVKKWFAKLKQERGAKVGQT